MIRPSLVFGEVARQPFGDDGHRAVRLRERDARLQPRESADPLRAALRVAQLVRREDQRPPEVRVARERRTPAAPRRRLSNGLPSIRSVDADRRPCRPPNWRRQSRSLSTIDAAAGLDVGVLKEAAAARRHAEHGEEPSSDVGACSRCGSPCPVRFTRRARRRPPTPRTRRSALVTSRKLGGEKDVDRRPLRPLSSSRMPIGIGVRQRPQQHAVDNGEDGGGGADAERQRRDRDGGEPG